MNTRRSELEGLVNSINLALDYLDELMKDAVIDDEFLDLGEMRNSLKPCQRIAEEMLMDWTEAKIS